MPKNFYLVATTVALFVLPSTHLFGQVGGFHEQTRSIDGGLTGSYFGANIAGLGDLDGDGYADYIVGGETFNPGGVLSPARASVYSGASGALMMLSFTGGDSVAGAPDMDADGVPDFIIGFTRADSPTQNDVGSVTVYSGATGSVIRELFGTTPGAYFGTNVASVADIDGDGIAEIFVGNSLADPGGISNAGSAILFSGASGNIIYQFDGSNYADYMGWSIDDAGDVNGDGVTDLLVGALGFDAGGVYGAGAAWVFSGATGSPLHYFPGSQGYTGFGVSCAGIGDVNRDGFADVLVGASGVSANPLSITGGVFVYSGATGTELLSLVGEGDLDRFGDSVCGMEDLDDDGVPEFVVGAPGWGLAEGTAYIYSGATGAGLFRIDGTEAFARLGSCVANVGDIDGDGIPNLAIGAPSADPGGIQSAGQVKIHGGFQTFLSLSTNTVSASAGGLLNLDLDFPTAAGGLDYKVLISINGVGPTHFGVDIPLTQDRLVEDTYFGNYPVPGSSNMHGTLNPTGGAAAQFPVPAGLAPSLIGRTFWFAAIATPAGQLLPTHSSVAVPVTITP